MFPISQNCNSVASVVISVLGLLGVNLFSEGRAADTLSNTSVTFSMGLNAEAYQSLDNVHSLEVYSPATIQLQASEVYGFSRLGSVANAGTGVSSSYSSGYAQVQLNTSGSGTFSSSHSYFAEAERKSGDFTADGGYAYASLHGGAYRLTFIPTSDAVLWITSSSRYSDKYTPPILEVGGQPIPLSTITEPVQLAFLPANNYGSLAITMSRGADGVGFFTDPRSVKGSADFAVRWGINGLPGSSQSLPIELDAYSFSDGLLAISEEMLDSFSDEPAMVAGAYRIGPHRTAVSNTPTSDGVNSTLHFQSPALGGDTALGHLIGAVGDSFSSITLPPVYGNATQLQVSFGDISQIVGLAETLDFTSFFPEGVSAFAVLPVDGTAGDGFEFGLRFVEGSIATVLTTALVPEQSGLMLAMSSVLPLCAMRGRKNLNRERTVLSVTGEQF